MIKRLAIIIGLTTLISFAETASTTAFQAHFYQEEDEVAYIGVTLTPEENWHTYWSNPGEAGMAPYLKLESEALSSALCVLPAPKRFETSGIVGYGYDKEVIYVYKITGDLPEQIKGKAYWLSCDDVTCLPGKAPFSFNAEGGRGLSKRPNWLKSALLRARDLGKSVITEPKVSEAEEGWDFSFHSDKELKGWRVFPYDTYFSELKGGALLRKEGGRYHFSFDYSGALPERNEFLMTEGKSQYTITFSR